MDIFDCQLCKFRTDRIEPKTSLSLKSVIFSRIFFKSQPKWPKPIRYGMPHNWTNVINNINMPWHGKQTESKSIQKLISNRLGINFGWVPEQVRKFPLSRKMIMDAVRWVRILFNHLESDKNRLKGNVSKTPLIYLISGNRLASSAWH